MSRATVGARKLLPEMISSILLLTVFSVAGSPGCVKNEDEKDSHDLVDWPTTETPEAPPEGGEVIPTPPEPPPAESPRHVVMVIDDGFDSSHHVFAGKIEASYTLECTHPDGTTPSVEPTTSTLDPLDPETFRKAKDALLAEYQDSSSACKIVDSIRPTLDDTAFAKVAEYRERWNAVLLEKRHLAAAEAAEIHYPDIIAAVTGKSSDYIYHGTATAGLIAFQNPNVSLVLLKVELSSPSEVGDNFTCLSQSEIDLKLGLLNDKEVEDAYVHMPQAELERDIADIARRHHVAIANFSAGSLARKEIEDLQAEAGCPAVSLSGLYQRQDELDRAQYAFRHEQGTAYFEDNVLLVRSAGNAGLTLDHASDSDKCTKLGNVAVIGATDYTGAIAPFSNRGNCVDYYMLGSSVVTAAPYDFLTIQSGTSFSAPLFVRYLTQTVPGSVPAGQLLGVLGVPRGIVPQDRQPLELAYGAPQPVASYTLVDPDVVEQHLTSIFPWRNRARWGR